MARVEGSSHAKNQLDSFIRFSRTPTCDGRTDGHKAMASTADAYHRAVKKKATVGRICRKGRFRPGMKERGGDG